MNTQGLVLLLVIMGLTVIGFLTWLATEGSGIAIALLAMLITATLLLAGAGIGYFFQRQASEREQQSFVDNSRENLEIMRQMQSLQNSQNTQLLKQVSSANRLPQPDNGNGLLIESNIFDELD